MKQRTGNSVTKAFEILAFSSLFVKRHSALLMLSVHDNTQIKKKESSILL